MSSGTSSDPTARQAIRQAFEDPEHTGEHVWSSGALQERAPRDVEQAACDSGGGEQDERAGGSRPHGHDGECGSPDAE
jgi:hypothetical protein